MIASALLWGPVGVAYVFVRLHTLNVIDRDAPEINHVRLSDLGIGEQQFSDWTQTTGAGRPDFRAVMPAAYGVSSGRLDAAC